MNYMIAQLLKDGLRLAIIKDGNRYALIISSDFNSEVTYKHFKELDHAFKAFTLISETMIKSLFNEDDKRKLLTVIHFITSLDQFKKYLRALEEAASIHPEDLQAASEIMEA